MTGLTSSSSRSPPGPQVRHGPAAGLRVGIRSRVGEVQLGDRAQVGLVEAVPPVVLVGDAGEHVGPHELGVGALVADPGGRAEVLGGGVARHGLLQLDADDQRGLVGAGPQVGDRGQRRDAAGRAGGLVAGRRGVPQPVVHGGGHRAEVALAGEQLTEGVGDVHDVDRGGVHPRGGERGIDHFGGQIGEIEALAGQVAAEVALVAAEDPDVGGAAHEPDDTTTNRVTQADRPDPRRAAPPARGLNRRDLGGCGGRPPHPPAPQHCPRREMTNVIGQSSG